MRILYLEDIEDVRESTQEVLESHNFSVIAVPHAQAALKALADNDFDLILSDYSMPPGMNGLEFLQTARRMGHDIPFILYTAYRQSDLKINPETLGIILLLKGNDPSELIGCIEACISKETTLPVVSFSLPPTPPSITLLRLACRL